MCFVTLFIIAFLALLISRRCKDPTVRSTGSVYGKNITRLSCACCTYNKSELIGSVYGKNITRLSCARCTYNTSEPINDRAGCERTMEHPASEHEHLQTHSKKSACDIARRLLDHPRNIAPLKQSAAIARRLPGHPRPIAQIDLLNDSPRWCAHHCLHRDSADPY